MGPDKATEWTTLLNGMRICLSNARMPKIPDGDLLLPNRCPMANSNARMRTTELHGSERCPRWSDHGTCVHGMETGVSL